MRPRPTSVLVLSIIGIVLAAITTLLLCVSVVPLVTRADEVTRELLDNGPYKAYLVIDMVVGLAITGLLWFGSIGSLMMMPSARKSMLAYAWATIPWKLLTMIITFAYVAPSVLEPVFAKRRHLFPPGFERGYWVGFYFGSVLGFLLAITLPILILVFFNSRKVKNAFAGVYEDMKSSFPVQYQPPMPPVGGYQ